MTECVMTEEEAIEYIDSYREYFNSIGGSIPQQGNTKEWWETVYLTMYLNKIVKSTSVDTFISQKLGKIAHNRVRSLWLIYGLDIKGREEFKHNWFQLLSFDKLSPKYNPEKRKSKPTEKEFEEIKQKYNYTCVSCGNREGEPHSKNHHYITKLQMGHIDPNKNLTIDNCIPQCAYCNQRNRDDYIYDNQGGIKQINNIRVLGKLLDLTKEKEYVKFLIEKHSKEEILRWINESN